MREDVLRWIMQPGARSARSARCRKGRSPRSTAVAGASSELIQTWGVDTVKAVMAQSIDHAREKLRKRLRELPDGVWRDVQYIDHDGHETKIYQIVCTTMTKGDALTFDFEGTTQRPRPHQLDLFGTARRRCCRPSTSTCAGHPVEPRGP